VPTARSATVWHDATGGRLAACMRELANQCLAPPDPARAFEDTCGTFWYYLLYTNGKLERGDGLWGPLQAFHLTVLPSLFRLLRLEAGALDEWFGAPAAKDLDGILAPERRSQLEGCAPGQGPTGQRQALRAAARLGRDVCAELARRHGWAWPETLAERAVRLLSANNAAGAPG
jgi:hypothetical protein